MKITVESTSKIVELNSIPARVWEGHSENGMAIHCFITRVAVRPDEPPERVALFERDLKEQKPPSVEVQAIPLRMSLGQRRRGGLRMIL
jgi:hypothetical protein